MANDGPDIPAFVRSGSRHTLYGLTAIVGHPNPPPWNRFGSGFNAFLVRGGTTNEAPTLTGSAVASVAMGDGYAWLQLQTSDDELAEALRGFIVRTDPIVPSVNRTLDGGRFIVPNPPWPPFEREGPRRPIFELTAILGARNVDADPVADEGDGFNFWLVKQGTTNEAGFAAPAGSVEITAADGADYSWLRIGTADAAFADQLTRFLLNR